MSFVNSLKPFCRNKNDRLSHCMKEGGGKGEGDCPTEKDLKNEIHENWTYNKHRTLNSV